MKKRFFPLIAFAILLAVAIPSAALINFISIDVSPSTVTAGQNFQITVTAVETGSSPIMGMSLGRNGNYVTQNCLPAQTCIKTWTLNEAAAGQYTYIIRAWNSNGQTSLDSVTVNVQGGSPPQTYIFRTSAIDGASMDNNDQLVYINPSTIKVGSVSKTGTPYASFTVNMNQELNVDYSATGYANDWDVFYFDSRLTSCTSNGCSFTRDTFTTSCDYVASPQQHYACGLTSTKYQGSIDFDYYPFDSGLNASNVIKVNDKMYRPGCPVVYNLTNVTFVNGQNYTGLDLDNFVVDDNTAKSSLIWTVSNQDYVQTIIGMSNIISIFATNPGFSGSDVIRFTASDGTCSDSDDLLVIVQPSNTAPTVTITNPVAGANFTQNCGSIDFNATANDPDGTIVSWEWIYNGATIGSQPQITIPANTFASGQNIVLVRATDNNGATASASVSFNIVSHTNPVCIITSPVLDPIPTTIYQFPFSQMLDFGASATATDNCNVPMFQYFWRDNGVPIVNDQQFFSMDNLTPGAHNMTLYVTDGLGGECYDEMNLNITTVPNLPPTAQITLPANLSSFVEDCEIINFSVNANDVDGNVSNMLWYFGSALIGTGPNMSASAASFGIGDHVVSVTVVDDDNAIATDSVNFTVVDHSNPTVLITSPINNPDPAIWYQFPEFMMLDFSATAAATDVCVPSNFQYIWRDNGIPIINNQQSFSIDNLSIGLHNITAYVTDGFGGAAYDTLLLNITDLPNIPPAITAINCYNQFGGVVLSERDPIFCNATAIDPDGFITMWQWTVIGLTTPYNLGPVFNQTLSIPSPYLAAGNYNVSLIVFDNETPAATDMATTTITVIPNQPPTVTILLPPTDPFQSMEFCSIDFLANASDTDGYIVPSWDPAYNWRISMSNGTNVNLANNDPNFTYTNMLPLGLNAFSVSVTDDDGAQASDSLVVNTTDNIPPRVNITLPVPFANYTHTINRTLGATPITFDAAIVDGPQDDCSSCAPSDYSWRWYDTFNGVTTQVASTQSFVMNNPQVGIHALTVQTSDCYSDSSIDTITVNVTELPNNAPIVTINAPAENQTFINRCDVVNFSATAVDPDNDMISAWMWSYLGATISSSQSFLRNASSFALGNNTVYAYAFDNQTPAGVGSDIVSFNVVDHTGPAVTVSATDVMLGAPIANGSQVNESRPIFFDVTALSTDTCNADSFTYYWEDNGFFVTTQENFTRSNLTVGMHMIKVIATDNYGYTGEDTIWINITDVPNTPPIVSFACYDLATGSPTLTEYQGIQCNATAVDPNGNNITTWLWDVDGDGFPSQVDDDSYILPVLLGNGTYNVSLTVIDDGDPIASTTAVVPITVNNNAPAVTLTSIPSPVTGQEPLFVNYTCSIAAGTGNTPFTYNMSFGNSATDVVPSGSSTQVSFTVTYSTNGTYNATCYVSDMDGDLGAASLPVIVGDSVPLVSFNWTPVSPFENQTVQFNDYTTAYDLPISRFWQFGDGSTATAQNPTHVYAQQGIYAVNLTVTDSDGSVVSLVQNIVVQDTVPTAAISAPLQAVEGTNVTIVGFGTAYDVPITYSWNFGDGSPAAAGQVVGHVYAQQGNYTITLTVTDNDGSTATAAQIIQITDTVPTANAGPDQTVSECTNVQFNGSLSTAYDIPISYNWNWGDSTPAGTGAMPTHSYAQQGAYTVNLTVTDADGSAVSDIMIVNILDTAPNAYFTYAPLGPAEGALVSFDSSGSSLNACDAGQTYSWTFGDSNTSTLLNPTHTYADQGSYLVNLTITDSDGSADSYALTIPVIDVSPSITSLSYAPIPTNEGDTVMFSSSALSGAPGYDDITSYQWNFGDGSPVQSGASLTNPTHVYGDNGTYTTTLTVYDEDSSISSMISVPVNNVAPNASAGGPYVCNPGGLIGPLAGTAVDPAGVNDPLAFAWDFDYNGTFNTDSAVQQPMLTCSLVVGNYTMAFRASDDDSGVTTVFTSVNVTAGPVNNAPQFVPLLGVVNALNNTLFTYDVNATDVDGDAVTYSDDSSLFVINPITGMISFTPTVVGLINVNVTACDDSGFLNNCTSDILGINVLAAPNLPPVANAGGPYSSQEGSSLSFNGVGSSDPDGTIVSWSWNFGDGVGTGSGPTPSYTYMDNGTYTVTLTVTDDDGATNTTTTTAAIANVAPSVNAGGPYSGNEGTVISLNGASATDPAGVNDPLSYAWDLNNDGTYETPGQTVNFNANDNGAFTVGLRVSDDDGGVTTTTATVNVNNLVPTAEAGGPYACSVGGTASLIGSGTDPAGAYDPLTYAWDLDNNLAYETPGQNTTFSCVSAGIFTVNLQVNDGDGGLGTDSAVVIVSAAPDTIPPAVTLQLPVNGFVSGVSTVTVQYYVTDNVAPILSCNIYSNTTGTWTANLVGQNTLNATSNVYNYNSLPNGNYAWNVQCSDGTNTAFAPANFTFTVNSVIIPPACANTVDDDADLLIDYPFDPGCSNATDTTETNPIPLPQCSDAADNDGDGAIDFPNDPGCSDAADNDETNILPTPQCADLADNDADTFIDWPLDPGCSGAGDNDETNPVPMPACSDGLDNDLDSLTDFPNDPGCVSAGDNDETNPIVLPACFNAIDDDGDLLIDYPADPGCYAAGDTNESNAAGNIAPTANAGPDQTVLQGTLVTLNGTGSSNGGDGPAALTYNWTQVSGPAATLSSSTAPSPTFTPSANGTYVFQLVVYDGAAYSAADTVTITVNSIAQSVQTALQLYNATGSPISTALPGQTVYAVLSIDNMNNYAISGITSTLTAAGFTITGASDSPPAALDNVIDVNIGALGATTVWWQMTAPGAGSYTVSVNTEGIVKTKPITV